MLIERRPRHHPRPHPVPRSLRPPGSRHEHSGLAGLTVALVVVAVVVALSGMATAAVTPIRSAAPPTGAGASGEAATDGDPVATSALAAARALADGESGAGIVPAEVAGALGYRPVLVHGLAADGDGGCSSPLPLPAGFEPACRVHDLGYDLLRVAHAGGTRIPRGLRADLDALLARQMHAACGASPRCHVTADLAHVAVHVNTVRQGHGAPVTERLPW